MIQNKKSEHQSESGKKENRKPLLIFYTALLFLFLLIAVASFHPDKPLWGINHLAFYPLRVRIIALSLMGLSFIPSVSRRFYVFLSKSLDGLRSRSLLLKRLIVIIPLLSIVIFISFRSSILLFGDGHLIARNFEYASEGYTNVITRNITTILTEEKTAKGATFLYYIATKISGGIFHSSPVIGIQLFNCLLGGIFVYVFLRITLLSHISTGLRIWMAFLVFSSGIMELFFGHVENYTPLVFFSFLYLISGFIFIHRPSKYCILINFLCLIVSIFIHIMAVLLVPSFILLLGWLLAGKYRKTILRFLAPLLVVLLLIGGNTYGKLSLSHWLDMINELLLLMPTFPIFVIVAFVCFWPQEESKHSEESTVSGKSKRPAAVERIGNGPWFSLEAEWYFAGLILSSTIVFLVIFKPQLGMPRDWDLFTLTFLGLFPLAMLIMNRFLGLIGKIRISLITIPGLVMSVLIGMAWIGINAAPSRATHRFEQILEYDKTNAAYAYEVLARHYYINHQLDEAIKVIEKAAKYSHNPRMYIILSKYCEEDGRIDDAINVLHQILQEWSSPKYTEWARLRLVRLLYLTGRYRELLEVTREGVRDHPEQFIYHFYLAKMLIEEGLFREAAEELQKCKNFIPPPTVLQQIDDMINKMKDEKKL